MSGVPAFPIPMRLATWLCLLLCALAWPVKAELVLRDDTPAIELLGQVDYLADPEGNLTLDDVRATPERFQNSAARRDLSFGYVSGAIWLRLHVKSEASRLHLWRLEISYPSLDRVQLHDVGSDGVHLSLAGDMVPYAERSIGNRTPVFETRLHPGESRTLYLRASSEGSMTLSSTLWPARAFEQHSLNGYVVHALYGGVLIALGLYNFLLFLALRERPFLFYVLFMLTFGIGVVALNGFGPQYLWPNAGWWTNRALPAGLTLASAASILFTRSFLDTPSWLPRWDRLLRLLLVIMCCAAVATLLLPVQRALQTMSISGLALSLMLLITGFLSVRHRVPGARLFVLAWLMLLTGALMLALRNFALIPTNTITLYAMQIGSSLEMILLSLALAARFNEHKRQKEKALQLHEKELEQHVAERTEALEIANQRLRNLALKDPLTGLANRTALQQQLDMAIRRTQRRQELLAVMLIDLDGFKPINDQHGHGLGDQVLSEIARRLLHCARETDLVARLGGDEFILICETVQSAQGASEVAERVLKAIAQPISLGALRVQVGASIGIALSHGEEDGTLLIRQADAAMYKAKAAGRNRVHVEDRVT